MNSPFIIFIINSFCFMRKIYGCMYICRSSKRIKLYMKYKVILFDVNKETHDIITKETINDENELYSLCYKNGWNIEWYDKYKEKINIVY